MDKRVSRNHALLHLENGKLKLCPVSMKAYIIVKLVATCGLCINSLGPIADISVMRLSVS